MGANNRAAKAPLALNNGPEGRVELLANKSQLVANRFWNDIIGTFAIDPITIR